MRDLTLQVTPAEVLHHFELPGCARPTYVLLCRAPVTVRSQQVRATNLAWALRDLLEQKKKVAVIGGGAAGLTLAAVAANLGAEVHLFERSSGLMHLQEGSWHRPLHPEIFTWPNHSAYRPVSYSPLLGWRSGTAHEVSREIVSKFWLQVGRLPNLKVKFRVTAQITPEGDVVVGESDIPHFDLNVLAVGFGTERNPFGLPLASYWRADAIDQSHLEETRQVVIIAGSGDGALIEVLRACVKTMDQGAFLDKILTMTLTDESLRTEILRFEEKCAAGKCKRSLEDEYDAIDADRHECLRDIDTFLLKHARDVAVTWLVRKQSIFGDAALPINRFLVSRLVKLSRNKLIALEIVPSAKVLAASWKNGRYFVQYEDSSGERQGVACSHAIIRYGAARRALTDGSDGPNESILKAFQETDEGFVNATQEFLEGSQSYRKDHSWCNRPVWSKEFLSAKDLPVESELFAEFVKLFFRPQEQNKFVYRIRIWLTGLAEELDVVYVLHPPDARRPNRRPVPRGAMDSPHEQWLNTALDYPIRVHSSDGREWYAGTVLEALRRHYRDKESSRVSDGGDILQTVEQAVATIESQTARNDVSSGL